jgi:HD-GYP domain-containing protein (c-di-GMP phosphodiesterase class II)
VRLAELVGIFSLATDAGTGVPEEHGLRSAALAVRLAELGGATRETQVDAFYATLLRYAGCTAGARTVNRVMGDEIEFGHESPLLDFGRGAEILPAVLRRAVRGNGLVSGIAALGGVLAALPEMPEVNREHCETAKILARRLGFEQAFGDTVYQAFERWDGSGMPTRARGDAIAKAMRLAQLALDLDRGFLAGGIAAGMALVTKHRGRELDPELVDLVLAQQSALLPILEAPSAWTAAMDAEPEPVRRVDDAGIDEALRALADFTDMKCRFTRGHSRGVAERASAAAAHLKLGAELEQLVYRAGLVHDLGRVAVSALVWNKAGSLTDSEWERVRLHTYVGERILAKAPSLAGIAEIATLAHERSDGKGYHRRLPPSACPLPARLLAAADVYQALLEVRPHRPRYSADEARAELQRAVTEGALAQDAVLAVLAVSGHRAPLPDAPAGLTARELEVLALVARGLTNKEIAQELTISAKTVGRHLEHLFEKLAVTTRSGATMAALQRGMIRV